MSAWIRGTYNGSKSDLNAAHPRPQKFDLGLSDRPLSMVRLGNQNPTFIVDPSQFKTPASTASAGYGYSTRGLEDYSDQYVAVLEKYVGQGSKLGAEIIDDANKALKVAEDVSMGAAIGAMIPILGEIGIGEAGGALIAGIYSVFDNFGGDINAFIHNTFNPEDFSEGDYDRMKANCLKSGGIPNWGHAPDNEDGCIYKDGRTSGGDYPRPPPPGVQSIRGDSFFDYDAFFAANPTLRPGYKPPMISYSASTANRVLSAIDKQQAATKASVVNILRSNPGKTIMPPKQAPPTTALIAATAKTLLGKAPPPNVALVASAMAGNPNAQVTVRSTVDAARAGDATAINDARTMSHAQRQIILSTFVKYYLSHIVPATKGLGAAGDCGCHR